MKIKNIIINKQWDLYVGERYAHFTIILYQYQKLFSYCKCAVKSTESLSYVTFMMPIESGYHVSKKTVILNAKQATAKISHMHTFLNSV